MAFTTTDVYLSATDGWTLVATDPASCLISASGTGPYAVAITAGVAPAANLVGLTLKKLYDQDQFATGAITGTVYIRQIDPTPAGPRHFGVIVDDGV